jgi:serine phosphatase RsbU (regulator of sigma subunit)/anti-sigma regulatory factor (Ser/Thr protein kinase)
MGRREAQGTGVDDQATGTSAAARWATLTGLAWCTAVAVGNAAVSHSVVVPSLLVIGPMIACTFADPRRTAAVGAYATGLAVVLGLPDNNLGSSGQVVRAVAVLLVSVTTVLLAHLRDQRAAQLERARAAEAEERRRRVGAEAAARFVSVAGALAAANAPDQVAEALFAAARDGLGADGAVLGTLGSDGVLRAGRRLGSAGAAGTVGSDVPVTAGHPLAEVVDGGRALIAEDPGPLLARWPELVAFDGGRVGSLAVLPMIVSGRVVGTLAIVWDGRRRFDPGDRDFLTSLAAQGAQALERARLTLLGVDDAVRAQRLQHLSAALAAAATPVEVAGAALHEGRLALGARAGLLRVPTAGGTRTRCLRIDGNPVAAAAAELPAAGTPHGEVLAGGGPLFFTDRAEVVQTYPAMEEIVAGLGDGAVVYLPLPGPGRVVGVLAFSFDLAHEFDEAERRFLFTLSGLCAQALQRAELLERERAARERLGLLAELTRLLSGSLDPEAVIVRLVDLVTGRLARTCVVLVPGRGGLRLEVVRGDGIAPRAVARLRPRLVVPTDGDTPAARAFRTGLPQQALASPESAAAAGYRPIPGSDPGALLGPTTAVLAVPLLAQGQVLGVMSFIGAPGGEGFDQDDVALAGEVAARAGTALANATRFQREHDVADTLQRAVLPRHLPGVPGLMVDAEYRAGTAGTYAGGDWYDVARLRGGLVLFSVGDVMGKGAPAAALMGQVRSALRAYAAEDPSPAAVLDRLDQLFDALGETDLVTAVVGTLAPATGEVRLANAGHPAPVLLTASGPVAVEGGRSMILGSGLGPARRPEHRLTLAPGDTLLLYSDGLIERRGEPLTEGLARLLATASSLIRPTGPGQRPAAALVERMGVERAGTQQDDVVVLSLHRPPAPARTGATGGPAGDELHLPPEVQSTTRARHWTVSALADLGEEVAATAGLLVSELVTNAVLHTGTEVVVRLHRRADRIRVDVADGSTELPVHKGYERDAATGRGLGLFELLASEWGVVRAEGGKVVWFEIPVDVPLGLDTPLPPLAGPGPVPGPAGGLALEPEGGEAVAVRLVGMPMDLVRRTSEHYDALYREFRLLSEDVAETRAVPARLTGLIAEMGTRFQGLNAGSENVWQANLRRAEPVGDLALDVPPALLPAIAHYDDLLEEADTYCRSGVLLTLPPEPAVVALRRWVMDEFRRQVAGNDPVPWSASRWATELTPAPR